MAFVAIFPPVTSSAWLLTVALEFASTTLDTGESLAIPCKAAATWLNGIHDESNGDICQDELIPQRPSSRIVKVVDPSRPGIGECEARQR